MKRRALRHADKPGRFVLGICAGCGKRTEPYTVWCVGPSRRACVRASARRHAREDFIGDLAPVAFFWLGVTIGTALLLWWFP